MQKLKEYRYDLSEIKAERTNEGFIVDTPVITRTGVFSYVDQKTGKIRKELRLPEEVFSEKSLKSLKGKPITNGHHGKVTNKNARALSIGSVLTEGKRDDSNVIVDIVITDTSPVDAGKKDLSCGYELDLEWKSGEYEGEHYDCIQRNILYNHVAVVDSGRAGNARLNLDGNDFINNEPEKENNGMKKITLSNGVDYDVPPEVAAEFNKINSDHKEAIEKVEKESARADAAEAGKDKLLKEQDKIKQDAIDSAIKSIAIKEKAKALGVEVDDGMSDMDVMKATAKHIRGDSIDLNGKSDAYIEAIYDLSLSEAKSIDESFNKKMKETNQRNDGKELKTLEQSKQAMIDNLKKGE